MRTALEIVGDRKVERDLRRLGEQVRNPRPAFERLFQDLRGIEREQFASRGHGDWPELKDSTKRQKKGSAPLIETGHLFRSLTTGGSDSKAQVAGDELIFGTRDFKARFLSKRFPLVKPSAQERRSLVHRLVDHLFAELR